MRLRFLCVRHVAGWVAAAMLSGAAAAADRPRPNVLFIAIDDQNDWVGHMGGHPLAQTPHLDALAARGTTFLNAHCNAPLCNPSRASLLTGLRPSTTGIYGLEPSFRSVPEWRDRITLPQHFGNAGYSTAATGKVFHQGPQSTAPPRKRKPGRKQPQAAAADAEAVEGPPPAADFEIVGTAGGIGTTPREKLTPQAASGSHPLVDWGVWPADGDDTTKGDWQVATWASEQIRAAPRDRPFFIAAGFFLPHVPCFATQKWFDLYPDDDSLLPAVQPDDRGDTPRFSWYLHWKLPEPRLRRLQDAGQWRSLVRSYLACTSFVDSQIGRLLVALEESGHLDDTIVVVWGDHGWHLGEKEITGKNSLWDRGTKVPLIFAGPGITAGGRCMQPAELLDVYPTLCELAGLEPPAGLEGLSLVPQLRDATTNRERPAVTTHNQGNHGVRSERWRYIRYADGSEELYDMQEDPHEWTNLAASPTHADVIAEHRRWLPATNAAPAAGSATRLLTYDPATDEATWEGRPVRRSDPIPE
jgi:arylsulfatase A-like enzyme